MRDTLPAEDIPVPPAMAVKIEDAATSLAPTKLSKPEPSLSLPVLRVHESGPDEPAARRSRSGMLVTRRRRLEITAETEAIPQPSPPPRPRVCPEEPAARRLQSGPRLETTHGFSNRSNQQRSCG
ncbi:hypothetical protein PR202_gb07803 [Eleusine coracana subsp. coracana]|uniref:Uncharacterized protein n=1 Tax=Eleusine coracana subsp. coracana TaxID=191504 RepID=A0AAV5ED11_ELECO|nr:hypothetical protein PR202_gb07803 [Eleusine coracana subsp. coracana]